MKNHLPSLLIAMLLLLFYTIAVIQHPFASTAPLSAPHLGFSALALITAAVTAWLACWLIVKYEHLHAHLSHDHTDSGPQKFHAVPTPRIGGLAVVVGLLAAGGVMIISETLTTEREFGLLLLASIPAFLGGLVEDITKKVGVLERLLLTMASGALAVFLLGAVLNRLDIPGIDTALTWLPLAILFTAFAVGGVANAINIIDGYNGLAGGYAVIVLAAFAWVTAQTHDTLLLHTSLTLMGALLGFLAWNWPKGKIFLGDGGAYLLGFLLAELSVLIVARNPGVSPWFPVLLLIYPIFETLFSIFRRKFARGHSPGRPDALHLHQLIYFRLVRDNTRGDAKLLRNNKVAPYYWAVSSGLAVVGVLLHHNTAGLVSGVLIFCAGYLQLYRRIVCWKSPRWMIRTHWPKRVMPRIQCAPPVACAEPVRPD